MTSIMNDSQLKEKLLAIAAEEPGKKFMGKPERWFEDVHWRCTQGHVISNYYIGTEEHGDACAQCMSPTRMTFPEDVSGPLDRSLNPMLASNETSTFKFKHVVFLDLDGVLFHWEGEFAQRGSWEADIPNPGSVECLNRITEETGAVICISSSWRGTMSLRRLRNCLVSGGVLARIVDTTPQRFWMKQENRASQRGDEIREWLKHNPTQSFVILDDDDDMHEFSPKLVLTSIQHGLRDEHVELAIAILMEET